MLRLTYPFSLRTTVALFTLGFIPSYAFGRLRSLERQYPQSPTSSRTFSHFLTSPPSSSARFHDPDSFSVRVPVRALLSRRENEKQEVRDEGKEMVQFGEGLLVRTWMDALCSTLPIRAEAAVFRLFSGFSTPRTNEIDQLEPGQPLLNGLFTTLSIAPAEESIVLEWKMASSPVAFFESIATRWGYPLRLMEGGRHEFRVLRDDGDGREDGDEYVLVVFLCAAEYRIVDGEEGEGKRVPKWVQRAHQGYARLLVDLAVRGLV